MNLGVGGVSDPSVALCLAEIGPFTGLFSQIRSQRAVLLVCFRISDHISAKQREMGLKLLQHIGYMIPPTHFGTKNPQPLVKSLHSPEKHGQ